MIDKSKLSNLFTYPLKMIVENPSTDINYLQEIRLRTGKPLIVTYMGEEFFVLINGQLAKERQKCVIVDERMISESLQLFSSYSLYAFEDEIKQGFITIPGGHRVGICGRIVMENNEAKTIKNISSMNIRLAHQVKSCAEKYMKYIYDGLSVVNTLIISPPGGGKTTFLRDMVRCISDGDVTHKGLTVGVVDERSEIAACYKGIPQNDVGIRTDVLDCCPKREGMMMLLRSMAPAVIGIDEIGDSKDYDALKSAVRCGCKIVATVHGSSYKELMSKPYLREYLLQDVFQRLIFLEERKVCKITDSEGNKISDKGEEQCLD